MEANRDEFVETTRVTVEQLDLHHVQLTQLHAESAQHGASFSSLRERMTQLCFHVGFPVPGDQPSEPAAAAQGMEVEAATWLCTGQGPTEPPAELSGGINFPGLPLELQAAFDMESLEEAEVHSTVMDELELVRTGDLNLTDDLLSKFIQWHVLQEDRGVFTQDVLGALRERMAGPPGFPSLDDNKKPSQKLTVARENAIMVSTLFIQTGWQFKQPGSNF